MCLRLVHSQTRCNVYSNMPKLTLKGKLDAVLTAVNAYFIFPYALCGFSTKIYNSFFIEISLMNINRKRNWHQSLLLRVAVRAGATGAIAPVDFQKWQIAPVNFEYARVRDKEITQKRYF